MFTIGRLLVVTPAPTLEAMMRHPLIAFFCSLFLSATAAVRVSQAEDNLTTIIAGVDGTVATDDEREFVANQVRESLNRRLNDANQQSTAEWNSVHSREDWERLKTEKLAALRKSLGAPWHTSPDLRMEVTGEFAGKGFLIQNLLFESRPGWWVAANLYVPQFPKDSMPGIVICHAHHTPKLHGELQDMGMTWARAGCLVIIPDQIGHGERRQHPFASAADYPQPFAVGRQDYFFRYDNAIQLQLVGESLIGWMAQDLSRCADVLLMQKGIDPHRILLLGSVAGGGDPAAVAGALDDRFAAVVPFNFGGPQPETRFPLPEDIEQIFNYAGSGSWESTRNLVLSAQDRFLPWIIVGGIAPRRLIYAHEFSWDRERDPVWKRLQSIYHMYDSTDRLAFTHGFGELKGQAPQASHCTHIGAPHRTKIHEAFAKWFGIDVTEYSERVPAEQLRCWTVDALQRHQPRRLTDLTLEIADSYDRNRRSNAVVDSSKQRQELRERWETLLGPTVPDGLTSAARREIVAVPGGVIERWMLQSESGVRIPCVLLRPEKTDRHQPVVLAICSQGKNRLMNERADELARLLGQGATVCMIDPRGIGESKLGNSHTRRSAATSLASTALMLGSPLPGEQLRDVRIVLRWLRHRQDFGFRPLVLWGESLINPNADDSPFRTPRDDDQALPSVSEPQGPLVVLLASLFEDDLDGIYLAGGLVSWRSLLTSHLVLTAYDGIVPGALTAGDLADLIAAQSPETRVRIERAVDEWNRLASADAHATLTNALPKCSAEPIRRGITTWLVESQ